MGDEPGQDSNGPDRHAGATLKMMMTFMMMAMPMMTLIVTTYPSFFVLMGILEAKILSLVSQIPDAPNAGGE